MGESLEKKVYRILSIDGGGILGLYSAKILEHINKEMMGNKKYHEYFNLITGTSTGGIISLGLAADIDIEKVVEFYEKYGQKIFPYKNKFINWLMSSKILFSNKYLHNTIDKIASDFFGTLKMKDAKCAVCIPSIDVVNCQPIVFKSPHHSDLSRDDNYLMKDIALATSSAPTYFPIYSFDNYLGLVDGGLWQNNPSLIGVIEACHYFVGPDKEYDSIEVLSIGNPHSNFKNSISVKNKKSSLTKWRSNLIELPMKITSKGTDDILNILNRSKSLYIHKYLRLASSNITEKQKGLSLDYASDFAIQTMIDLAHHDYYENKEKIRDFFK